MHTVSITPQQILDTLVETGVLTGETIITMLGESRHTVSLNELEMTLVSHGVLTQRRLLQLKGMISGLDVLDDPEISVRPQLDADTARRLGAFVVDRPVLTVAVIEDLPETIEALGHVLGTPNFDVWFMCAPQFDEFFELCYGDGTQERLDETVTVFEVLDEAVRRRASDIHLSAGLAPAMRVDGGLASMPRQPLSNDWLEREVAKIAPSAKMDQWRTEGDADFAYTYGPARFRVNLGLDRFGMTVALRKIPTVIPTMEDLGLPQAVMDMTKLERGLVLVVGPTGSGKSTTLASMLGSIARTQARHIITLEDPIEFFLPAGKSVVHQREYGQSFFSFPQGLRQALRQDPDIVLVGEMRDAETIKVALTAAETGHLVLGTLHTYDAASTVARIVSTFGADEQDQVRSQLGYILKGVVAQSLLPLANSKGRVAAFEVMTSSPAISNNLRKVDGHNQLRQTIETSSREGMQTIDVALVDLVRRGMVSLEDAEHRAPDREAFARRLEQSDF